jgi:hypothetical protein
MLTSISQGLGRLLWRRERGRLQFRGYCACYRNPCHRNPGEAEKGMAEMTKVYDGTGRELYMGAGDRERD